MTQPIITNTVQNITVQYVGNVTVTDIATDSNGNFVREIRVVNTVDTDNPNLTVVFTLRLSSPTQSNIAITTPSQSF